jgi:hypothetical protein
MASAKANYAMFMEDRLDRFFELQKEISIHTSADADSLFRKISELNTRLLTSMVTTLGLVLGALLSTATKDVNGLAYSALLVLYSIYVAALHVWYLPSSATNEFLDQARQLEKRLEPYRQFLDSQQVNELFIKIPSANKKRFEGTRSVVRIVNGMTAFFIFLLSGFDMKSLARSFSFEPAWGLGRWIVYSIAYWKALL